MIKLLTIPRLFAVSAAVLLGGFFLSVQSQAPGGFTRLLRTPAVSPTQIAFAYANNIWTVPRAGGSARRLTSFQGQTMNPHFSPDGKWIAFSLNAFPWRTAANESLLRILPRLD